MKIALRLISAVLCFVMLLGCITVQAEENYDKIREDYLAYLINKNEGNSALTKEDILIQENYGNHSGYDIVIMGVAGQLVSPATGTLLIGGITFTFGYEAERASFYAYKDGEFIHVRDAFDMGLLSKTDIYNIAVEKGDIVLPKYRELWSGDGITMTLEESTATLYISGEGRTDDYDPMFIVGGLGLENYSPVGGNTSVKHVVVDEGITYLGKYLFSECENIESVELPCSLEEIGDYCFDGCKKISHVIFPEGIRRIGNFCFENENLNTLTFYGNLPKMKEYSVLAFFEGTVYYPEDNSTWNKELMAKYKDVTWEAWSAPKIKSVYNRFDDVSKNAWFTDAVQYVYDAEMMVGIAPTLFSPNSAMTRAQMVQILFNLSGENKEDYMGESLFKDVPSNAWYAPAINWAKTKTVTAGIDDNYFAPNRLVTRLEMVVFLDRFAYEMGCYEHERADIKAYDDENKVGAWGYGAMQWAVQEGIISGMTETTLAPNANANRAQAARMLMKYNEYLKTNITVLDNAYAALVDYIIKNGTIDTDIHPVGYNYVIEEDGKWYLLKYKINGRLTITYCTMPESEEIEINSRHDFDENIEIVINDLANEYEYEYYYMGDHCYIISTGLYATDGFKEDYLKVLYMDEEDVRAKIDLAMSELSVFIEKTMNEFGMTAADLFTEK